MLRMTMGSTRIHKADQLYSINWSLHCIETHVRQGVLDLNGSGYHDIKASLTGFGCSLQHLNVQKTCFRQQQGDQRLENQQISPQIPRRGYLHQRCPNLAVRRSVMPCGVTSRICSSAFVPSMSIVCNVARTSISVLSSR